MIAPLVHEVLSALQTIPREYPPGAADDAKWGVTVRSKLEVLGKRHKYLVCSNECDREWLFDLVWYRNTLSGHLSSFDLALECEWDQEPFQILFDFNKLLIAKAPLKVMVFQDKGENLPDLWKMLLEAIATFAPQNETETYVLAAFREAPFRFEFQIVNGRGVSLRE